MSIRIDCPACGKEVARMEWVSDRAELAGTITAENGDPGGTLTSYSGGRRRGLASSVIDVDITGGPGASSSAGRKRLVCRRRGHRDPKPSHIVSQKVLDASYQRLSAAGRDRATWVELKP